MIVDCIENYERYLSLSPRMAQGLRYLQMTDFSQFEPGEYSIVGRDIFAIVSDNTLQPLSERRLEGHRKYIDIQFLVSGAESIGYAPRDRQSIITQYDESGDFIFCAGNFSSILLDQGMFAIFFPEDLHMPGIGEAGTRVRKVVVKVKI